VLEASGNMMRQLERLAECEAQHWHCRGIVNRHKSQKKTGEGLSARVVTGGFSQGI